MAHCALRADQQATYEHPSTVLEDIMSKKSAAERRESRFAQKMRSLAASNPEHFKVEWRRMLEQWSMEAIRRGQLLRQGHADARHLPVFDVLKKAQRVLALCGSEADCLVGPMTRELLSHDCSMAFAHGVEPGMYRLGNTANNCDLAKMNTYKPFQ